MTASKFAVKRCSKLWMDQPEDLILYNIHGDLWVSVNWQEFWIWPCWTKWKEVNFERSFNTSLINLNNHVVVRRRFS